MEKSVNDNNTDNLNEKIEILLKQTTMTQEEIIEKLKEHNNNEVIVLREWFGLPIQKPEQTQQIKKEQFNQQIFKEFRKLEYKLKS